MTCLYYIWTLNYLFHIIQLMQLMAIYDWFLGKLRRIGFIAPTFHFLKHLFKINCSVVTILWRCCAFLMRNQNPFVYPSKNGWNQELQSWFQSICLIICIFRIMGPDSVKLMILLTVFTITFEALEAEACGYKGRYISDKHNALGYMAYQSTLGFFFFLEAAAL